MKYVVPLLCFFTIILIARAGAQTDLWVSAYYPGYQRIHLPIDSIDFNAVTHIMHFAVVPDGDGSFDSSGNEVDKTFDIVQKAHAFNRKVLITVGGANTAPNFESATRDEATVWRFANNLTRFVITHGYDGIDIDWEPLGGGDSVQFINLANALRADLNVTGKNLLLTATAGYSYGRAPGGNCVANIFAFAQAKFDQINLMTYDLAGPYQGWITWHNAPIYNCGATFPSDPAQPLPSADGMVRQFLAAGVAASRLAIGIDFYGCIWSGESKPRQSWVTPPAVTPNVPYYDIMNKFSQRGIYHWDVDSVTRTEVMAGYFSMENASNAGVDTFISFDNQQSCRAKVAYTKQTGISEAPRLGGVMIWELGGGWRDTVSGPGSRRDSLLQSIKNEVFGSTDSNNTSPGKGQRFLPKVQPVMQSQEPGSYSLEQNFPNPFNPVTTIQYRLASASHVRIEVYNTAGQRMTTLIDAAQPAGNHEVHFDGNSVASGVYFYMMKAGTYVEKKKMLLVK